MSAATPLTAWESLQQRPHQNTAAYPRPLLISQRRPNRHTATHGVAVSDIRPGTVQSMSMTTQRSLCHSNGRRIRRIGQACAASPGDTAAQPSEAEAGPRAAAAASRFVFAVCEPGSERAVKAEVQASVGQRLRPGFSRPGLVTWVADSPEEASSGLPAVGAATGVRVSGPSLGRAESAAEVAELILQSRESPPSKSLVFQVICRQPDAEGAAAAASAAERQLLSFPDVFSPLFASHEGLEPWVITVVTAPGEAWVVGWHSHAAQCGCELLPSHPALPAASPLNNPGAEGSGREEDSTGQPAAAESAGVAGRWVVSKEHHKMRISRFLSAQGVGNMDARRALRSSRVLVNDKVLTKGTFFVKTGQSVLLLEPPQEPDLLSANQWASRVLYEDQVMVAVDKPPGFTSTPSDNDGGRSVLSQVEEWLAARDRRPMRLMPLHRLDKNTSGCLLLSKEARINAIVGEQFRSRKVKKEYFAVVRGIPDLANEGPAEWCDLLEVTDGKARVVGLDTGKSTPDADDRAVTAKTTVRVSEIFEKAKATALKLQPHTGRTHQLRVQCEARGHAVVGDEIYGPPQASSGRGSHLSAQRLVLHCSSLVVRHPLQAGKVVELQAPLPPDVQALLRKLREYGHGAVCE